MHRSPRFGIDARSLNQSEFLDRGIGRVVLETMPRLFRAAPEVQWTVFGPSSLPWPKWRDEWGTKFEVMEMPPLPPLSKSYFWARNLSHVRVMSATSPDAVFFTIHEQAPAWTPFPTLCMVHDLIWEAGRPNGPPSPKEHLKSWNDRTAVRKSSRVLCNSDCTRRDLAARYGVDAARVQTSPLGFDAALFSPDPAPSDVPALDNLPASYFLYVGGFDARKNVSAILEAYTRFCVARPNAESLLIAGAPVARKEFLELVQGVASNRLFNKVFILGHTSNEELAALYRHAKALIFPSDYEGFGLPLLEAMACATPVLTRKNSAIPEVVGDAALFLDEGKELPVSLLEGMLKVSNDPGLRADLAAKSLVRSKIFSWDRFSSGVLSGLFSCIGQDA